MSANPFIRLYEAPAETLTAFAYAIILLALLLLTWWALTTLVFDLYRDWRNGWLALPPLKYVAKAALGCVIVAVDLLLIAGIIHVLT